MSRTILLVDSNSVERNVLTEFLKSEYEVLFAETADEAIKILKKQNSTISTIVIDTMTHEMGENKLLKKIKKHPVWSSIPVVVKTGLNDDESFERAIACGADNFLTKPLSRTLVLNVIKNTIKLKETTFVANDLWRDKLTGLLNRDAFFSEAERMIQQQKPGYYVLSCFNIENFKVINDQYGMETGDAVLQHVANSINVFVAQIDGLSCRYTADWFAILYPVTMLNSPEIEENHRLTTKPDCIVGSIRIRIGRYLVSDKSVPINIMFDRASLAESTIKNRYDVYIADYTEEMREKLLAEQEIVDNMSSALENGEYEPWLQPQYNHATGALIGAEALVRWRKDGKFISPVEFIPIFERNGFIYEMDKYIWEQVCILLRRWIDEGREPLPISINISRRDLQHAHLISVITGIVEKYSIPYDLLRLEITESALTDNSIIEKVGELIKLGFTVEIDDFGSGYSSLNTLKDVPITILKLDMRFFEATKNTQRGGSIIESVVRMAKWLDIAVIAEGVEEKIQADFLKSIGCYYIQGYLYAKPMPVYEYEKLLEEKTHETKLLYMQTIDTLDNNLFWDPKSMETLIFNSYVGGACIFELYKGETDLLRINDQYIKEFGGLIPEGTELKNCGVRQFSSKEAENKLQAMLDKANQENKEVSSELKLSNGTQTEYVRYTVRVIARTNERILYYAVIVNETELREAERKQKESTERLSIIMDNVNGGVSAIQIFDNGTSNLIFHNDKYYELFGYTHEQADLVGFDPISCILPESYPSVMMKIKELKKSGIPVIIDYAISKADGSVAFIRANCSLMEMEGYGQVITSVLIDVTEQRTMQDQLRAIIDNINGGVTAIRYEDDKPELLLINNKYFDIIGYTKEEFESEVADIFDLIHPDDRERIKNLFIGAWDQSSYTMEYKILRKNGAVRHILCNTSIIYLFGVKEPVQLSVINDITAFRETQQKERNLSVQMNTVMKNISGGITATVFHDKNNIEIVFANDGYYELYGYTREEFESEISNVLDLIVPEDCDKTIRTVEELLSGHGDMTYEYRCRKRDGSIMWTQMTSSVISMSDVEDTVLLSVLTDITGLRNAEEESRGWADRLSAVMNAMTNGITAVTFANNKIEYLFANDRYCQMHGVEHKESGQEEMREVLEAIHPDDRQHIKDIVFQTTEVGQHAEAEYRICLPDDTVRYAKIELTVTKLIGIYNPVHVAIYSDVTAEKKANLQLSFLNKAAHDIITEQDCEKAINDTVAKLVEYLHADHGFLVEVDTEKMVATATYEVCADGLVSKRDLLKCVPFETMDIWYQRHTTGEYFVIPDVSALDDNEYELREMLLGQGIKSIVTAPLMRDGRFIGFIGVDNLHEAVEKVEQITALADYFAILLNRRDMSRKIEHDTKTVQQLMDDTPGGFLRLRLFSDKEPVIVSVNEGFCKLLSMTRDEVMKKYGNSILSCLAPEDAEHAFDRIMKAYAPNGQYSSRCRLKKKNGEYTWVMLFGRFVQDENGKQFLNSYFTDITEKRAEEENQKELLDNLPFGAGMYKYDGNEITVIHTNRKYSQLVGRNPAEYKEVSIERLIHPDDRQLVRQEVSAAIRLNRSIAMDLRIKNGSDGYTPFHITSTVVNVEDGNYLLYVCYDPISDEVMSLQEMLPMALSTIVSNTEDISYVKDKDLRYICVSQAVADIAGTTNPRDLIGKTAEEVFPKQFGNKFSDDDRRVLETGKTVLRTIEHIPTIDGGVCLARTSKFPILNSNGIAIGVYCVSRDITAQKEKESRLELLTESVPGGLAAYSISDKEFRMLYFNDSYFDYSGYTREEYIKLIEHEPLALMLSEDRPALLAMVHEFSKNRKDGLKGECSYRCRTRDGEIRYMSMRAILSQVGENHFVLNAVQLDITKQKLEEEKQIMLLDNLPFGAGMYEYDGKNITSYHINKQYGKMVGRSENCSNTELKAIDYVYAEDRTIVLEEIQDAIANNRNAFCIVRLLCGDGAYKPFRLDANIVMNDEKKYTFYVVFSRISEEELSFKQMLPHMFDTIMESSTDLAFAKDINFRYIRCSKTFADILGLESEKDVIGKTDYELFPKEIADTFRRDDSGLFADGKPRIDINEAIPSPDGTMHYTRVSKHLLRDTAGNTIGVYCIGRDVTEIREAFAQLQLLTNTIPGGIATFRCMPGNIETVYFSDGISALAGYTREEYQTGKKPPLQLVFNEDRGIIRTQIELLMSGETTLDFIFRIHTNDGGYKWLHANAHATDRNGEVFTVSTVLTDVTEAQEEKVQLRRAKEEYRIIAGHSNRTICRYQINQEELTILRENSEDLNMPSVVENIPYGKENLDNISEDTRKDYLQFYEGIIHGEKESYVCYRRLINNSWCWLDALATTVFDDSGMPISAVISFLDITEQREKEAIYSRWQNSLSERPDESYTLFRANLSKGVSFESRTGSLLDIDFGNIEVSFDELTNEYIKQRVFVEDRDRYRAFLRADTLLAEYMRGHRSDSIEYREIIDKNTSRWMKLSVDLVKYNDSNDVEVYLMYENIDEEKRTELRIIERAETDPLTGLLNRSTFAVRVNQMISESAQGVCHALLMIDIDGFKQVNDIFGHGAGDMTLVDIADLLTKAVRREDLVGRLGGDEFVIFLSDVPDRESVVAKARKICEITRKTFNIDVRISASIGIAMYPIDGEGFEALYKTADETLYSVKDTGKDGYSFSNEEPVIQLEIFRGNISSQKSSKMNLKKHRMLIVDDSVVDRTLVAGFFKNEYVIEQAADGATALKILRHYGTAISVVLLDLMMTGMSGFEMLEKMKNSDSMKTIPVIIVSTDESRDTALSVIRAGATDLITKPVDSELLRVRVEAAVSRAENERLIAMNSFLSLRNSQTDSFRAALEYSGIIVITLNWTNNDFLYSPGIESRLAGKFDGRTFWRILLSDMITDTQTVQKMQQLVHNLAVTHDRQDDGCTVRLKTPSGLSSLFDFRVFKESNEYGLADKMIMTLREMNTNKGK